MYLQDKSLIMYYVQTSKQRENYIIEYSTIIALICIYVNPACNMIYVHKLCY